MTGAATTALAAGALLLAAGCVVQSGPAAPQCAVLAVRAFDSSADPQEPASPPAGSAPKSEGQASGGSAPQPAAGESAAGTAAIQEADTEEKWTWSIDAYAYAVANGGDYVSTIARFDRGSLHLEARYNYEDLETASLWTGVNFEWGHELTFELTPMFGVVFGNTSGVAPGYHFTLGYGMFELYSEGEYVVDTRDDSGSFFYSWTEATVSPVESLRTGIVAQRLKPFESDSDVQGGVLLGVTTKRLSMTAYMFNAGWDDPSFMFAVAFNF